MTYLERQDPGSRWAVKAAPRPTCELGYEGDHPVHRNSDSPVFRGVQLVGLEDEPWNVVAFWRRYRTLMILHLRIAITIKVSILSSGRHCF